MNHSELCLMHVYTDESRCASVIHRDLTVININNSKRAEAISLEIAQVLTMLLLVILKMPLENCVTNYVLYKWKYFKDTPLSNYLYYLTRMIYFLHWC